MQKHKLPLIFFLLISFITFSGCENPSLPTETNNNQKENDYITVSFDINGQVRRTVQVLKDQTLKENQLPPENFTNLSNWKFLYWSESKNSKKEAIEFDYSRPLTKDITLYAIFTPNLSEIQFVSSKLIEISTYDDDIFVLNDGSIPGMKLLYSKDNINYEPIDLSIPNGIRKEKMVYSTYVYITYAFENRLTQGTHYFKVSNGLKETPPFTYEIKESFENPKSVYFNNNGAIIKIIDLESGSKISSSDIPENPYANSSNTFLYWSKSKSSQEEAIEFDFTSEITEDTTLYALYTPDLFSYSSLSKLSSSGIELKFYSGTLYPLDDGSFAGIHFLHSTNNTDWETFDSYITSIPLKKSNDIYTYNFISPLPKGNHYFKVTNGDTTTSSKNITIFEEQKTVTFISNDSTYKTITVSSGEKVSKPDNPSKYGNHFMYWAKSKASKNEAVSFDFKTPITENITLYAIYTPTLASNSIQSFNPNQIVIKLYENNVFTFDDGSYAGLNFSLSTDKITYEALDFSIPSNYTDIDGYRYLTFLFTPQLPDTTQYVKVTNGHETGTSAYSPAKAVTNVNAETNDSFVKISFTSILGWTSYTVTAYKNGESIISKTLTSDTEPTDLQAEFYGLDNATEYTFKVITDSTDKFSEITVTPEIKQKESDWLVVMYLDGDNDLHEPIYIDMNEAEYGLRQIRKSDRTTATDDYDSVNVVALWDGAVSWKEKNIKTGKEETVKPRIGKTGTYLFELGTDYSDSTTYTDSAGCVLSDETKNLSYTAGWIVSEKTVSTTPPTSYGEVNMGSEQNLENFLKWVKSHYTAKKGIILQFSDHGGGPRSARYVETPDGKIIKVGDLSGRRALCWDESSASSYLKTKDVSDALEAAGFINENKAKIILMDLCLGSSVEDAYQFKDYAEYYAASPNTIPALGLNYV